MELSLNSTTNKLLTQTQNNEQKFRGTTKQYIFDINKIENKLQRFDLKPPSSSAYQSQLLFRQKNQESELVRSVLKQQQPEPFANLKKQILQKTSNQIERPQISLPPPSQLFNKAESIIKVPQSNQNIKKVEQPQKIQSLTSSSYSNRMHDFRKTSFQNDYGSSREDQFSSKRVRVSNSIKPIPKLLEPILENEKAQISILPPKSRQIGDPDNNIVFLDNGSRIINPINVRTPPPPFWGEEIEEDYYDPNEDFYNHEKAQEESKKKQQPKSTNKKTKRLKKKVVYVYESDSESDEEQHNNNEYPTSKQLKKNYESFNGQPRIQSNSFADEKRSLPTIGDSIISRRQASIENDKPYKINAIIQQNPKPLGLLSRHKYIEPQFSIKPPLISSGGLRSTGVSSKMPQSRQIRTGAFQILPMIAQWNKLQ